METPNHLIGNESEPGNSQSRVSPGGATPQLIPARMLNEFVYCPRLFYYEFVEGVFLSSADTLKGDAIHQRVDSGSGAIPASRKKLESSTADVPCPAPGGPGVPIPSEAAPETIHSRSVQMGSDRLGVVAKMDLVEVRAVPGKEELEQSGTTPKCEAESDLFSVLDVCPVDYKVGAPREGSEGAGGTGLNELWDTDKVQLGLQALILRDNGYTCTDGVIYYRATKQRVHLPITPELESWILEKIEEAKRVITGPIPAPLVRSPKCVRCSLAPVCLPDETRMLTGAAAALEPGQTVEPGGDASPERLGGSLVLSTEAEQPKSGEHVTSERLSGSFALPSDPDAGNMASPAPPRRLIAARDDARPLYLNTPGYRVGCKDEVLVIKERDRALEEVRIRDLSHVALFGNVQISTQAIQALCEQEVPVTYFSMGGWFYGITRGHSLKNVFLRMEQFRLARDEQACLALARRFVHGKIRNHRTLLMRNHLDPPESIIRKLKRASEDALAGVSIQELLGIEGAAASQYFQLFSGMVKVEDDLPGLGLQGENTRQRTFNFNFNNRNRRPPMDPVNAMLSLAYSLLSKDCTLAALAVGFDPYLGFYHQPRFGRPALGLDLMEEFRPLIAESTVLSCINNRVITDKDFVKAGQAVNLSAAGRKRFFQTYEQRMSSLITHPLFDYKVSYRRALELQARLLAKAITGEIPEYVPLLTR